MSRIVVKNLPKKISEERIREVFGAKGTLTDVHLKHVNGKFRNFGFLGYKTEEEAKSAMNYFNGTFINTSKIKVELCTNLGDPNKPRAWSKYSKDSSAYKQSQEGTVQQSVKEQPQEKKKKSKKSEESVVLSEALEKVKDDPQFAEFLAVHKNRKNKALWSNDAEVDVVGVTQASVGGTAKSEKKKKQKDANKGNGKATKPEGLSDLDYLKSKMVKGKSAAAVDSDGDVGDDDSLGNEKQDDAMKTKSFIGEFSVKMNGLPAKCKKSAIKQFFDPIKTKAIRVPQKIRGMGIAYVDFTTEKDLKKALTKHKGFLGGKRVTLARFNPSKVQATDKQNTFSTSFAQFAKLEEDLKKTAEPIAESGILFVRNLPYTVTEEDLENHFKTYGPLAEVRLPVERLTRKVKGFAFVVFVFPEHAAKAHSELDGTTFQGRVLHILPGKAKLGNEGEDGAAADEGSSYKKEKAGKDKAKSGSSHNWNALFLGANAVANIVANKYNTTKQEMLNPESSESVAVRLALGETQIVIETRNFLLANGIELDAFSQAAAERSKTVILVKNLPWDTPVDELRDVFSKYGEVGRVVFPPSGITAVVEFLSPTEAKRAFQNLAYTKFYHVPLYLEWAPVRIFKAQNAEEGKEKEVEPTIQKDTAEGDEDEEEEEPEENAMLFVKNLDLETEEEALKSHFEKCGRLHSATVSKKKDMQNPGSWLSMGYGFVQFLRATDAKKALKTMQHSTLENSVIELKLSHRTVSSQEDRRKSKSSETTKQKSTKILVRNIPFEATAKEVSKLFSTFGEFKAVRLPKKMAGTGSHRGFAFVDFVNRKDAKRAFEALCHSTHLYGRRLVLEWAETDDADVNTLRRKTAQHFQEAGPPAPKKLRKAAILEQLGEKDENY